MRTQLVRTQKENTLKNRLNLYQTARLALFTALVAITPGLVGAQPSCASLNGSYAGGGPGIASNRDGTITVPTSFIAIVTFASGKLSGSQTAVFNGVVGRVTFSGDYTLNSNCTGSATFTFQNGTTAEADLVVAKGGKTFYGVITNNPPGNMSSFTFTKM